MRRLGTISGSGRVGGGDERGLRLQLFVLILGANSGGRGFLRCSSHVFVSSLWSMLRVNGGMRGIKPGLEMGVEEMRVKETREKREATKGPWARALEGGQPRGCRSFLSGGREPCLGTTN